MLRVSERALAPPRLLPPFSLPACLSGAVRARAPRGRVLGRRVLLRGRAVRPAARAHAAAALVRRRHVPVDRPQDGRPARALRVRGVPRADQRLGVARRERDRREPPEHRGRQRRGRARQPLLRALRRVHPLEGGDPAAAAVDAQPQPAPLRVRGEKENVPSLPAERSLSSDRRATRTRRCSSTSSPRTSSTRARRSSTASTARSARRASRACSFRAPARETKLRPFARARSLSPPSV